MSHSRSYMHKPLTQTTKGAKRHVQVIVFFSSYDCPSVIIVNVPIFSYLRAEDTNVAFEGNQEKQNYYYQKEILVETLLHSNF